MNLPVLNGTPPTIDFWFEFGSNYSYLTVMRIEQDAAKLGIVVRWQPFLLGPIFQSLGWKTSPFVLHKAKGDYVWKDMQRQCDKLGVAWTKPSVFPRSAILPLRVAVLAAAEPWMAQYCRRVMQLNFVEDRDVDSHAVIAQVLTGMGLDAQDILERAVSAENKLKLRAQTQAAQEKGIFGAPTFFVGDEMFWGNDRLDDALAFCARPKG